MDRRMFLFAGLAACAKKEKPKGPTDRYELEGAVVKVDRQLRTAVVRHGDVKDATGKVWMAAMTMEFPVKEASDLEKLKEGVRFRAALYQRPSDFEYWLAEVQVLP